MSILKILWKIFLVLLIIGIGAAITYGGNLKITTIVLTILLICGLIFVAYFF